MVSDAPASSREDGSASASPICPSPERSASLISSSISCRVCHGPASCADRETHARSRKHLVLEQFPQACVQRRPNHGPGLRGASWDLLGRSADSLPKSAETSAAPRYPLRSLSNSLNARRTSASVMRPSQSDITETYRELALPTDFSRLAHDSHLPAGAGLWFKKSFRLATAAMLSVTLASGRVMPMLGLGVYKSAEKTYEAVMHALRHWGRPGHAASRSGDAQAVREVCASRCGYRHIDTAAGVHPRPQQPREPLASAARARAREPTAFPLLHLTVQE